MLELLTIVYLFYAFIGFYFLFLYGLVYIRNKNEIFSYPKTIKNYSLSIVVPCYNEEKSIGGTIESLLNLNYKNLKKIIIVDDCSTDNSFNIIKEYAKKYSRVMLLKTPKNTGKAAGAKNYGAKFANTDLIGFVDADSYPEKNSVKNMMGFFQNKNVAAVTASILVKEKEKFIERLQAVEYRIIAFTRKILGFIGAIYVTPGPLAIYRKSLFEKLNGFDEENLTEDIELTWNLLSKGYRVEMNLSSQVYTVAPNTLKAWYKQRIRWNVGGIQTILKYRKIFAKRGILGCFVLPFFVLSWVLGIFGAGILIYRGARRLLVHYLATKYSLAAQTAVLTLREINLAPNILIFFGTAFIIMSLFYTILALSYLKDKEFKKMGLFSVLMYSFVYVLAYPFILIASVYKYLKKKRSW